VYSTSQGRSRSRPSWPDSLVSGSMPLHRNQNESESQGMNLNTEALLSK